MITFLANDDMKDIKTKERFEALRARGLPLAKIAGEFKVRRAL